MKGRHCSRVMTSTPVSSQTTDGSQAFPTRLDRSLGWNERVSVWQRPAVQLLGVFVLLGLLAWWTFRTVSLPPSLRNLFDEDDAIAVAAVEATPEEQFQKELQRLPAPPENHAPEVTALLLRIRNLPPTPYLLQVARQRDAAARQGETAPPWNPAELAAEAESKAAFLAAWEPFLSGPPVAWEKYPDSARLFRNDLFNLMENPQGGKGSDELFLGPDFRLIKKLQGLGTLRFGTFSSWSATDTVMLSKLLLDQTNSFQGSDALLRATVANFPAPPSVEHLRSGFRIDRSLFLSAAQYLESLPPATSAKLGLTGFLGEPRDANWFVARFPQPINDAPALAALLRRSSQQISTLEQKTFLPRQAWQQWLNENPAQGLPRVLAESLEGVREFETMRMRHQLRLAFLSAALTYREMGLEAARRIPDPTLPGQMILVETSGDETVFSTTWTQDGESNPPSFTLLPSNGSP